MIKKPEGIIIAPPAGVKKEEQQIAADIPALREGHTDLTVSHLKDFFNGVRTRKPPRGNLDLAYTVQVPLLMAMQSHLNNKVALFDPEKETIRLG